MKKVEDICQKFTSLKRLLNESNILKLCNQPFKSIYNEIQKESKEDVSSQNLSLKEKNNLIKLNIDESNNKAEDYFKNLLISLESSKKEPKSPNKDKAINSNNIKKSPKIERSRSPSINNDNDNRDKLEKEILNEIKGKTMALNEDEEENNESSSYKIKINNNFIKQKSNKNISFYIIDKIDKHLNISEKISEFLNDYDDKITLISKTIPQMKVVDDFYYKSKESLLVKYIIDNNLLNMDTIKKIIHLIFNVLSKIFSTLIKESENKIKSLFNNIIDIIEIILEFIKLIKKFIINNSDNVDITFLKEMKNIANYCLYTMIIKRYNYEYMSDIENKKENEKKIKFFGDYMKYFKIIKKLKPIFKDNNLFMKHFMIQPSMITFIDLFEMNRKIINFQLNVNYKI